MVWLMDWGMKLKESRQFPNVFWEIYSWFFQEAMRPGLYGKQKKIQIRGTSFRGCPFLCQTESEMDAGLKCCCDMQWKK